MIVAVLLALKVTALVLATRATFSAVPPSQETWLHRARRLVSTFMRSPLLVVLAYALVDDLLVEGLHRLLFNAPEHSVRIAIERHGWPARAAYHLETALVTGWPVLLAAAAWTVFYCGNPNDLAKPVPGSRRSARLARQLLFGGWLIAAAGLAACFPLPIGWTQPILRGIELLFVAFALGAIPGGWKRRTIPTREGRAVGLLVIIEMVVAILGAWGDGAGVFRRWDELARLPYCIAWTVLCGMLIRQDSLRAGSLDG